MLNEPSIAVFIDFENLALGVRDVKGEKSFKIELILKRLLQKGRVVYKRAYSDWSSYRGEVQDFHRQGIELVDIPQSKMSGKNSADIRMVVDAIDLCHTKDNIDIFALISGDSDFSPLVSKLKENNKRVIGCGIKNSTSNLLVSNCDEFIYYDDLVRATAEAPRKKDASAKPEKTTKTTKVSKASKVTKASKAKRAETDKKAEAEGKPGAEERNKALMQVVEIVRSLQADYDPLWGSMVKQTIRRVYPGFNEVYYGYSAFAEVLEDVEDLGYIDLEFDQHRGNYKVSLVRD